jgi:hypothetical protein
MSGVFQNIDPPPLTAQRVCTPTPTPPLVRVEDTLAGWKGCGGSIFWKTPDTALWVLYIRKYFMVLSIGTETSKKKL